MSKRFTHMNDSFTCEVCGKENPPAEKTCRNHCRNCLYSKHVDINPGDRSENCKGVLKPVGVDLAGDGTPGKIVFKCQKCGSIRRNKVADDDDRDELIRVFKRQLLA